MYMNKEQIKKRISFGREYPLVSTWNVICQLIFNKLNVQLQFNFISDDDISGFGYGIPGEAKFFSVDAARNFKSGFGLAILIADRPAVNNIQFYFVGDVADGHIAGYFILLISCFLNRSGFKLQLRVFFGVKEIIRFKVLVAVFVIG